MKPTPEQIAYRKLKERRRLQFLQRKFQNHCKYILGGTLAHRLRVSRWNGLEDFRESLEKSGNLATIEAFLDFALSMENNNAPNETERSQRFDEWLNSYLREKKRLSDYETICVYFRKEYDLIKWGLENKHISHSNLAEKLGQELNIQLSPRKVAELWREVVKEKEPQSGVERKKRGRPPKKSQDSQLTVETVGENLDSTTQEQIPGNNTVQGQNAGSPTPQQGTGDSQDDLTIDES